MNEYTHKVYAHTRPRTMIVRNEYKEIMSSRGFRDCLFVCLLVLLPNNTVVTTNVSRGGLVTGVIAHGIGNLVRRGGSNIVAVDASELL
jgi:hypothetical protein